MKTIEDQGEKQVEALKTFKFDNEKLTIEDVIPKNPLNTDEAKKELICETNEYTYSFNDF